MINGMHAQWYINPVGFDSANIPSPIIRSALPEGICHEHMDVPAEDKVETIVPEYCIPLATTVADRTTR